MERRAAFSILEHRNDSLSESNNLHWNALTWSCYYCNQSFPEYKTFKSHIQSTHQHINSEDVYYKCNDCNGVSFSYVSFVNHIRRVHYESLKLCCDVCNEILPNYEELSSHRNKHVEAGVVHPIIFHCTICELVHSNEKDLIDHIQSMHSTIYNIICPQNINPSIDPDDNMDDNIPVDISQSLESDVNECKTEYFEIGELFQCGNCVQGFLNDADLEAHMLKHKEEQLMTYENSNQSNLMEQVNTAAEMEFTFEDKLIEEVKKNNVLYNENHPQYKHTNIKEAIWQQIGKILNSDAEQCKRKWNSLREQYSSYKKAVELPSGSSVAKRSKWRHLDPLSFLDDVDTTRQMTSNAETVEIDSSPSNTPTTPYRSDCESIETTQEGQRGKQKSKEMNAADKSHEELVGAIMKYIKETSKRMNTRNIHFLETSFLSFAHQIIASELPTNRVIKLQRRISSIIFDTLEEWEEDKKII